MKRYRFQFYTRDGFLAMEIETNRYAFGSGEATNWLLNGGQWVDVLEWMDDMWVVTFTQGNPIRRLNAEQSGEWEVTELMNTRTNEELN